MRLVLLPVLLTAALAGCTDHGPSPSPEPDKVYIWPQFVEPVSAELIPQLFPGDWTLEGTTGDRQGQWALAGSPLVVRVHSPLYEPLEVALVVPDTVSANDDGTRWYRPAIAVQRVVPALLSAEWTADFTGPTIRLRSTPQMGWPVSA